MKSLHNQNMYTEDIRMKMCIIGTKVIVGMLILVALPLSTALAEPIPDPVLYFNPVETDQVKEDTVWRNAGTAGGEVEKAGVTPVLEEGLIEIKQLRFKHEAKWYTPKRSFSVFTNGARHAKTPVVNLEDFTMGLLMKVNGPFFRARTSSSRVTGSPQRTGTRHSDLAGHFRQRRFRAHNYCPPRPRLG